MSSVTSSTITSSSVSSSPVAPSKIAATGNDLFGSQAGTAIRSKKVKTNAEVAIDGALYECPDNPYLEYQSLL